MLSRRALSVVVALTTGAAIAAFAVPGSASAETTVQIGERTCAAAKSGQMSCFAMRLETKTVSTEQAKQLEAAGVARPAATRPALAFGPAGGYTPTQMAKAYGLNAGASTSQTVAIVDAFKDPSVKSDLNHFDAQYGLPSETSTSFTAVSQTGGSVSGINSDVGWSGEITLDVDAVRGLCHKCKILLVEANSNSDANLGAAVNYAAAHAKIVSNSYGGPETDPENTNAVEADYNHPGVAILASTGDDGWYAWDNFNAGGSSDSVPSTPASYNTVVGVGGTTLNLNPNGTRAAESVWNDNGPYDAYGFNIGAAMGAAGSGCSGKYAPRLWQQKVAGYSSLGCGSSSRDGVDIASEADYFTGYDTYETTSWCSGTDDNGNTCPNSSPGWVTFGGTSLSSPSVAAMWALAGGPAGVKYPALTLYGHYKSDRSHLYDVTVGGTGLCDLNSPGECFGSSNPNVSLGAGLVDCAWGSTGTAIRANRSQCYAAPGYDGVSGVGTPKGTNPFKPMSPTAVITKPSSITHGHSASFSGAKSSSPFPGGSIKTYSWNWGDGHNSIGKTASHTYAKKGTYKVTLTVTDTYTTQNNGRVGRKTITITVN
jgi:subtilase family serine protease